MKIKHWYSKGGRKTLTTSHHTEMCVAFWPKADNSICTRAMDFGELRDHTNSSFLLTEVKFCWINTIISTISKRTRRSAKRKLGFQPLKHQLPLLLKINNHTKAIELKTMCVAVRRAGVHVNDEFMNFDDEPQWTWTQRKRTNCEYKWTTQFHITFYWITLCRCAVSLTLIPFHPPGNIISFSFALYSIPIALFTTFGRNE